MTTDTPEAWGREALQMLRLNQWIEDGSLEEPIGKCPSCYEYECSDKGIGVHAPDCPLASLIERGEAMFKENE